MRTQMFKTEDVLAAYARAPGTTKAAKVRAAAAELRCSPPTVLRYVKGRSGAGLQSHSPGGPAEVGISRTHTLRVGHPATMEHRTLFPTTVRDVGDEWLLKSGQHSAKMGSVVAKGPWKGFPIYTLTLEERATCPTSCRSWSSCLAPDTPTLIADLKWIPLGNVAVGDRIAAFTEHPNSNGQRTTKIAIVEAVRRSTKNCFRVVTDRGAIVASEDHLWLRRRSRWLYKWHCTEKLKKGDKLQFFAEPWETDTSYDAGRLRGFVEGEGYCGVMGSDRKNPKTRIGWSQRPTKLCDEIVELANKLGFNTARYERIVGAAHTAISHIDVTGGWRESARFLGRIRPTRMIERAEEVWSNHALAGRAGRFATVIDVQPVGFKEVVEIKTSSNTLVAGGFFTHNCYGNHMQFARRWRHGEALEWRLRREVAALELRHPGGFAVRLHSLGDFYSVGYVAMWRELLERHCALHVFGYTAHVDIAGDEIAYALGVLVRDYWLRADPPRFAVRFSDAPIFARSTVKLESPVQRPADAVICPAQWASTPSGKRASCCATCALCWDTDRRIAFLQH